jgi:tRNA pseudouridine32 synthase/23S rRNA pseudouridine746 synthase
VELSPITGRSHQLRVHLSAIGHPILGDDIYALPEVAEMAERLLLHAESLMIMHPGTGKQMGFERGCPF